MTADGRLRWSGSLAIAVALHAAVLAALVLMAQPALSPGSDAAEIEVALVEPPSPPAKSPPVPEPDEGARPRPVPPSAAPQGAPETPQPASRTTDSRPETPPQASRTIDSAPEATPPALQNHGLAIRPGPMSTADPIEPPTKPLAPDVFASQPASLPPPKAATPAPPTRLAPLIVTANAGRDQRLPAYPADARRKGEQGDVLIEVELEPGGAVRSVRVKKSSGHASLDAAAARSARALRFRPPRPPPGVVLHNLIMVEIPFSFRL